jgi:hypothetical protein
MILPRKLGYFLFSMHTLVDRSRVELYISSKSLFQEKKKLYIRRRQRINLVIIDVFFTLEKLL